MRRRPRHRPVAGSGRKVMSGVVLAVLDRPRCAAKVLSGAECLAQLTRSARINVIAIRMPPEAAILPSEEILTREDALRIRDSEDARVDQLRKGFYAWSANLSSRSKITSEWFDFEGMGD